MRGVKSLVLIVMLIGISAVTGAALTVDVQGDRSIRSQIAAYAQSMTKPGVSEEQLTRMVVERMTELGYLDAVASSDSGRIVVTTGPVINLRSVTVEGTVIPVNKPFSSVNLKSVLEQVIDIYRDSGYYYCRAQVTGVQRTGNSIDAELSVVKGPIVKVREIVFEGLRKTHDGSVRKYFKAKIGSPLTNELLTELESSAESVPYLDYRGPIEIAPLAGYHDANVKVHYSERQQVLADGGAGYDPERSSGLVWNLNLRFQNLFGDGKQLTLLSARRQAGNNLLDIGYRQPFFVLGIGDIHGRVNTRNYEGQFYEFALGIGSSVKIGAGQSAGLDLAWKRVDPEAGISYRRYEAGITYSLDQRKRASGEGEGFHFGSTIAYAYRLYGADSVGLQRNYNDTRAEFRLEYGARVAGPVMIWGSGIYRGIESREIPIPVSELYFVGGPGTLRGFRTDQFLVQRFGVVTVEPRLLFHGGYLFGFCDNGYLNSGKRSASSGTEERYRVGYGFGATISDKNRSVSISFGWNRDLAIDQPQLAIQMKAGL